MSVSVEQVSVAIDGVPILYDVDLELDDREVVAVLGPSGSGKTTLLRVIAGLQRPSSGRVVIDGRDVTDVATHRRGIGLMFQDHALFPHRDVAGNVGFGLRMAGTAKGAMVDRIDEVLELVGLGGFGPRQIAGLSGGERQRVALARALAPRPSVLLLDEPLGSLDRALRDRLLEDLAGVLRASGATVIHVTHDQGEAFATGDRIVVMREGRIAQIGGAEEVWHRPVDAGVARIVGPVTMVPVEVRSDGRVIAPWGDLAVDPVDAERAMLVLRADSLALADEGHGDMSGTIARVTFRGDHTLARIRLQVDADPGIEVTISDPAAAACAVGDVVELRVVGRPALVADDG